MRFIERRGDEGFGLEVEALRARREAPGDFWDECAVAVEVPAEAASARAKTSGNVLPRFSTRRRIPAHALGLKKYRSGSGSGSGSKMSDKEDTLTSLGQTEELSIQHSPREAIPEFRKGPEKAPEGVAFIGQNSGDVLPEDPPRA